MGVFDDLIPAQSQQPQSPEVKAGAFDDLIPAQKPDPTPTPWSEVGSKALKNLGPSALQFGKDLVHPLVDPVGTSESVGKLVLGTVRKFPAAASTIPFVGPATTYAASLLPDGDYDKSPDAVGKFFADRYGGMENFKKTMAEDPVGFASDLSTVLSGGSAAAAKLPGLAGKTAQIAGTVGRAIDPINIASKGITTAGNVAAGVVGNLGTHTGTRSLQEAARSGYEGGEAGRAFRDNMRGNEAPERAVEEAADAVKGLVQKRGDAYRASMANLGLNNTVLNFNDIDAAVARVKNIKQFKGESLSPKTAEVWKDIDDAVTAWKGLNPADYHTPAGLDALKQKLGEIHEFYKAESYAKTPSAAVAGQVYNAVRSTIIKQVPEYEKIMKGYESASDIVRQMEKTLSLNPRASVDTALRKLQSVLRDNVNTSYGYRAQLAEFLKDNGAPHLMERLSGQSLSSWFPRGFGKLVASAGTHGLLAAAGAAATGAGPALAAAALTAPWMSPRLMGELAHKIGQVSGVAAKYPAHAGFQAGRDARVDPSPSTMARVRALLAARQSREDQ